MFSTFVTITPMNATPKLSTHQAAELLEVDPATIGNWIRNGQIKAVKKNPALRNSHYLIERSEVDRLLSERMTAHYSPKDKS